MILITGASGHLGKAVARFLRENYPNLSVAALVRDPEKAAELVPLGVELRQGDYNDYASLVKAFRGADKLFLVSSNDVSNRQQQQTNAVNAAKEAGVKHIFYTSFQRKTEDASSPVAMIATTHLDTERQIKTSGLGYTILKNGLYMDVLPLFLGNDVASGRITLPAGNGKVAFVLRQDLAEASARLLAGEGHANQVYELAGSRTESLYDLAGYLTETTGRPVTYANTDREAYLAAAADPQMAGFISAFGEGIRQGEFDFPDTTLEKLLGRKPVSLKQYLAGVYAQ